MSKTDLSYKAPDYGGELAISQPSSKPKTKDVYPSITIRGEAAEKLMKGMEAGEMIEATVRLKCIETVCKASVRKVEYSDPYDMCRVELEMHDMEVTSKPKMDKGEKDETVDEAIDKYRNSKSAEEDDEDDD